MKLPVLAALLALTSTAVAQPAPPAPAPAPAPPVPPQPATEAPPPDAPTAVAPGGAPPVAVAPPAPAPAAEAPAGKPPAKVSTALGKGIQVATADDKERMEIRARLQLRGTQISEGAGDAGDLPEVTEFQARRIRLLIQGHVLRGEITYYLQLSFSNLDNEPDLRSPVRDAYVTWTRHRDLNIRGGQMKVPFGKQRVVSSSALQMPDRSIVVGELNLDRDVGVQALSQDLFGLGGKLAYNVGLFHGDGRNRLATAPGVLLVGRLVLRPFGAFEDTSEVDFEREERPKLAIALGAAHNDNTNRPRSTLDEPYDFARFDYTHATADLVFKYRGFALQSELIYRRASRPFVEADLDEDGMIDPDAEREYARSAWGYYAQAGYLFPSRWEVVGRYGEIRPRVAPADEANPGFATRRHELGAGLNYYWQKHDLKIQSDYFWLYGDDVGEGRHQVRVQMQLYY